MPTNDQGSYKAGFVNILGKPNVGKSTLMNKMVGERLSIITSRAQTTRNRIHGILTGDNYQVVFSDTPGILDPNYKLQEYMLKTAKSALNDADVFIYMTESGQQPEENDYFIKKLKSTSTPLILIINKIDLTDQENLEKSVENWHSALPDAEIIPISALKDFNIDKVFNRILELIPNSPPFYPEDMITDKSERFIAGEIIREKILENYRQEIPYSVEIEIESFKEDDKIIRIRGVIHTEKESQKGILIGQSGSKLKKVGMEARVEMESFFNKKIYLELFVKVQKEWRNDDRKLKKFGYR